MSCKKTPTSSNGSGGAQNRSISEIVRSLKGSFLDTDFEAAVRELSSREDRLRRDNLEKVAKLRERCDVLEGELKDLKVERVNWGGERLRFRRECDASDDKLKELTSELISVKTKEENAVKRYNLLFEEVRKIDEEKEELKRMLTHSRDEVEETKRKLREKEYALEEYDAWTKELEEVKSRNLWLEEEKLKCNARLEELERENGERVKELLNRNGAEKSRLEAQLKARGEELEEAVRKNEVLEDQKVKLGAEVEKLRRNVVEKDEKIQTLSEDLSTFEGVKAEIVEEKDKEIQELLRDKDSLDMEKRKLTENLELVEERFSKLEKDVIASLKIDLEWSKSFGSTHVEKIISGIIKVLDSEENGLNCNAGVGKDGNTQQADSAFVTNVNEPKYCSNLEKQSSEAVKKTLDFTDTAAGNNVTVINLDSDDDNENSLPINDASNKRKCPGNNSDQRSDDSYNNSSLNPKCKIIKSEPAPCKQVKQELSGNDRKFTPAQKETLSRINRCITKHQKEFSGSRCFTEDNGKSLSPEAEEYMITQQKRKQIGKLICRADMILALDRDKDLCAKAVCALYRQQMALPSGVSGSNLEGSKRFEECDFKRVTALAEFLVDGDPRSKLKKSVDELEQHDSNGPSDCKTIATKYSAKLFEIYIKRKDPLFSPSSNPSSELQYM